MAWRPSYCLVASKRSKIVISIQVFINLSGVRAIVSYLHGSSEPAFYWLSEKPFIVVLTKSAGVRL
jgi:uncharacterized membrane protein YcaP (DUF421 family)